MDEVFNWQIRRKMPYQYPGTRPKRQFAMVFDTNKCIACQTCSLACKTTWTSGAGQEYMMWNNVETKPYGGFPLGWETRLLELLGAGSWGADSYAGKTIFEAAPPGERVLGYRPHEGDWAYPNLAEDEIGGGSVTRGMHLTVPHKVYQFYLPRICGHCTYPACLAACPRQAIYKREEDGIVLIDQERCRGYGECIRACPYKKTMYNVVSRTSEKCIGCYPKVEQGLVTQCAANCIGKIRVMGFVSPPEQARADNPVDFLVHVRNIALPLYPQYGLETNVYYIPPIHAPLKYLTQMFGPGVEKAIEAYRNAPQDPLLVGLMTLTGATETIMHRFTVEGGNARAFDDKGNQIADVPVTEPIVTRPAYDEKLQVFRHNIT